MVDLSGVYKFLESNSGNNKQKQDLGYSNVSQGFTAPESWNKRAMADAVRLSEEANRTTFGEKLSALGGGLVETFTKAGIVATDLFNKSVYEPSKALGSALEESGSILNPNFGKNLKENLVENIGEKTYYEKKYGVSLTDWEFDKKKGLLGSMFQDEDVRDFVATSAELPTYFYGGSKGIQTLMSKGAPLSAKVVGNAIIGAQTGALQGATNTFRSEDYTKLHKYFGSALSEGLMGGVIGAASTAVLGAPGAILKNKKLTNTLTSAGFTKTQIKQLTRDQIELVLKAKNPKAIASKIIKTLPEQVVGAVNSGNKYVDELASKLKVAYSQLSDVADETHALRVEMAKAGAGAKEFANNPKETMLARRGAMAEASKDFSRTAGVTPIELSQAAETEIRERILQLPTYKSLQAEDALNDLLEGNVIQKSRLDALSEAVNFDLTPMVEELGIGGKIWKGVNDFGNFARSVMSSGDISMVGRQAFPAMAQELLAHPIQTVKLVGNSLKYLTDEDYFINQMKKHALDPDYQLFVDNGLELTQVGGNMFKNREEAFASNWAEKFALTKWFVKPSERQAVGFLNDMRMMQAKRMKDAFVRQGIDPTKSKNGFRAAMELVGAATGRATPPKALANYAETLNATLFSSKLMFSRLRYLNPTSYFNPKIPRVVRMEQAKQLGSMVVAGLSFLSLAKAAGAEVELDARSSRFAKAKFGDTTVDLTGGFQPYMRTAVQLWTREIKNNQGQIKTMGTDFGGPTRLSTAGNFVRGKLNPIAAFATDAYQGEDMVGNQFNIPEHLAKNIAPLAWRDALEAIMADEDFDIYTALGLTGASLVGFGMNTDPTEEEMIQKKEESKRVKSMIKNNQNAALAKYRLIGK